MSLLRSVTSRSIENPAVPLTHKNILEYLGFAPTSDAGVPVNEKIALTYSAVIGSVKILAESIAQLPLIAYEKLEGGGKKKAENHPAFRLVHEEPNDEQTPAVWQENLTGHLCTWGNAYSRIFFDTGGRPVRTVPLLPDRTKAVRLKSTGRLVYRTRVRGRPSTPSQTSKPPEEIILQPEEVIHIPGLGFDGITGHSPIAMARQAISLGLAAEKFTSQFYKQGAWAASVLKHPAHLKDDAYDRLKKDLATKRQGLANAWAPVILEEGLDWKQIGLPAEDALFLQLRMFQVREIARIYRIPPHMLADMEKGASFASVTEMSLEFVKYTLGIYLVKWQQELTGKLTRQRRFFVEFTVDAFLRGATKQRYEAHKIGIEGGWLSINDVLGTESMPHIEGGDDHLRPLNMGIVGKEDPPADPQPPEPEPEEDERVAQVRARVAMAHRRIAQDAADRMVRKELDRAGLAAKKSPEDFATWAGDLYRSQRDCLSIAWLPAAEGLLETLTAVAGQDVTDELRELLIREVRALADETSENARAALVYAHELGKLDDLRNEWKGRPLTMAVELVETVRGCLAA